MILALVAYVLMMFLEVATFIVVVIRSKKKALDFFNKTGRKLDVVSASRHRSFRNVAVVSRGGVLFQEKTEKTISFYIGINKMGRKLTRFGWVLYYGLYVVDAPRWFEGGHCAYAVKSFNSSNKK